jgi:type II secretory ATPase GspE/PulE/Tfp pilus assembly ATPase PilB-like protein
MATCSASDIAHWQAVLARTTLGPQDASDVVDALLRASRSVAASDVHLQPTEAGVEVRWRLDGVLQRAGVLPAKIAANVIARLKVLAELLTYRVDVPQEGRIRHDAEGEMRLSIFPTVHGERAVIRLFGPPDRLQRLDDLRLPAEVRQALAAALRQTSGLILTTGPAGCGKTTTAYACLRELAAETNGSRSIASLEDPVEVVIPGVAQSQAQPAAGFDLASGLRFLLRQDPEVILVGEIRGRDTAEVALQAALTGHLVLTTFHAGSTVEALGRLLEMGLEPYVLRSSIALIVSQRLLRRLCDCKQRGTDPAAACGMAISSFYVPQGCAVCNHTGYQGRVPIAETLTLDNAQLAAAVLQRADAVELARIAMSGGMNPLRRSACQAVEAGITSPVEVIRVLGLASNAALES